MTMLARMLLGSLLLAALAPGADAKPRTSMKGWELYTWFDLACSASPQLRSEPVKPSLPGSLRSIGPVEDDGPDLIRTLSRLASLGSGPNPDSWCVALVPGTNRDKSTAEIKRAAHPWADLRGLMAGLARGEMVIWGAQPGVFDRPSDRLRAQVVAAAKRAGVALAVP